MNHLGQNSSKPTKSFERIQQLILSEFTESNTKQAVELEMRLMNEMHKFQEKILQQIESLAKKSNLQYQENDYAIKSLSQAMIEEVKSASNDANKNRQALLEHVQKNTELIAEHRQNANEEHQKHLESITKTNHELKGNVDSLKNELKKATTHRNTDAANFSNKLSTIESLTQTKLAHQQDSLTLVEKTQSTIQDQINNDHTNTLKTCKQLSDTKVDRDELIALVENLLKMIKAK